MPLNIADYLRDTTHLDAEQSGMYLHLIMGYWVAGGLPNDDRQLAAIARVPIKKWKRSRALLEAFFSTGFHSHKRIDYELQRAADIKGNLSMRGKEGARKRWLKHASSNGRGNAQAMLGDAPTQRKKDLTDREIEVGAVDKSVDNSQKGSAEEASERTAEAFARMRRRKGNG
jgi:uncharacterized protein YdaU (DUF1376 family)